MYILNALLILKFWLELYLLRAPLATRHSLHGMKSAIDCTKCEHVFPLTSRQNRIVCELPLFIGSQMSSFTCLDIRISFLFSNRVLCSSSEREES